MDVVEQGYGPGDWPVSYSACEDLKEYLDEAGRPEQQDTFEAMATQLLWEWTGRRFGTDIVSLRPEPLAGHQQPTYRGTSYLRSTFAPVRLGGALHAHGCKAIVLPGNVYRVHQIRIDGRVLPSDSYRVYNRSTVVLTGRTAQPGTEVPAVFPSVQDLSRDVTEEGTWEIRYSKGVPVPEGGQLASRSLVRA